MTTFKIAIVKPLSAPPPPPPPYLERDARVQPSRVDGVADQVLALHHVQRVVNDGADLTTDRNVPQSHHQVAQRGTARLALGKHVAKL